MSMAKSIGLSVANVVVTIISYVIFALLIAWLLDKIPLLNICMIRQGDLGYLFICGFASFAAFGLGGLILSHIPDEKRILKVINITFIVLFFILAFIFFTAFGDGFSIDVAIMWLLPCVIGIFFYREHLTS